MRQTLYEFIKTSIPGAPASGTAGILPAILSIQAPADCGLEARGPGYSRSIFTKIRRISGIVHC